MRRRGGSDEPDGNDGSLTLQEWEARQKAQQPGSVAHRPPTQPNQVCLMPPSIGLLGQVCIVHRAHNTKNESND
eukprot:scaffold42465_cov25-Prasinocladus_malaysianus.AAC.1